MTSTLSTSEKQAFEQLLEAWNAHQTLRLTNAPFDQRVTALDNVTAARANMQLARTSV